LLPKTGFQKPTETSQDRAGDSRSTKTDSRSTVVSKGRELPQPECVSTQPRPTAYKLGNPHEPLQVPGGDEDRHHRGNTLRRRGDARPHQEPPKKNRDKAGRKREDRQRQQAAERSSQLDDATFTVWGACAFQEQRNQGSDKAEANVKRDTNSTSRRFVRGRKRICLGRGVAILHRELSMSVWR
jgi:hypothetical protein